MYNMPLAIIIFTVWWIISLYLLYITKNDQSTINKSLINKIFYLFFFIGGTIFIVGLININY